MKSSFSEYFNQHERKKSNGPDKMMLLEYAKKDTMCPDIYTLNIVLDLQ
jgi:hypothetical protein